MKFGFGNKPIENTNEVNDSKPVNQILETKEINENFDDCRKMEIFEISEIGQKTETIQEKLEDSPEDYNNCNVEKNDWSVKLTESVEVESNKQEDFDDCKKDTFSERLRAGAPSYEKQAEVAKSFEGRQEYLKEREKSDRAYVENPNKKSWELSSEQKEDFDKADAERIENYKKSQNRFELVEDSTEEQGMPVEEVRQEAVSENVTENIKKQTCGEINKVQKQEIQKNSKEINKEIESQSEDYQIEAGEIEEAAEEIENEEKVDERIEKTEKRLSEVHVEEQEMHTEKVRQEAVSENIEKQVGKEIGDAQKQETQEKIGEEIKSQNEDAQIEVGEIEKVAEEIDNEEKAVERIEKTEVSLSEVHVEEQEMHTEEVGQETVPENIEKQADKEINEVQKQEIQKNSKEINEEIESQGEDAQIEAGVIEEAAEEIENKEKAVERIEKTEESLSEVHVEEKEMHTEEVGQETVSENIEKQVGKEIGDAQKQETQERIGEEIKSQNEDAQIEVEVIEEVLNERSDGIEERSEKVIEATNETDTQEKNDIELQREAIKYVLETKGVSYREASKVRECASEKLKDIQTQSDELTALSQKKFQAVMEYDRGTFEYKNALKEYNEIQDQREAFDEEIVSFEDQYKVIEQKTFELRDEQIEKGKVAIAASSATLAVSAKLQNEYNDEFYTERPDKEKLTEIQNKNINTIQELLSEKDSIELAMDAKMDEIREYVDFHNMSQYESEKDSHYQQLITEYKNMQNVHRRINYNIVKLDENNVAIAVVNGKQYESIQSFSSRRYKMEDYEKDASSGWDSTISFFIGGSKAHETDKELLRPQDVESFSEGYKTIVIDEEIVLYRVYGGKSKKTGSYFTTEKPSDRMEAKLDLSLDPQWGNSREYVEEVHIPEGTVMCVGKVGEQETVSGNSLPGGGEQIIIVGKVDKDGVYHDILEEHPEFISSDEKLSFVSNYSVFNKKAEIIENDNKDQKGVKESDNDYIETINRTPINNGTWMGERGESKWRPDDKGVQEMLSRYGETGIDYESGYPDFEPFAACEVQLEGEEFTISNISQFESCNTFLSEYFSDKAAEFACREFDNPLNNEEYKMFLQNVFKCKSERLEDIQWALDVGETPYGYTWHHDIQPGRMLLVPTNIHMAARHKGGQSLWGGGTHNR